MIVNVGLRRFSKKGLSLSAQVAALFSAGEQGAWYDPSDFSTMFQDAAGSIPVTAVGKAVGLILDKSKGAIRNNGMAEYNRLLYTEEITNSYWFPSAVSKSVAAGLDGTDTAVKITPNTLNAQHYILPAPGIPLGQHKFSFYAKSVGYRYLGVWGLNQFSYFDLIDGVVSQQSVDHLLVSITKLNDGWNYIDIRFTPQNANSYRVYAIETVGVNSFAGNDTSGILFWHPDFRSSVYANAEPIYQRKGAGSWLSEISGNHATQTTDTKRPVLQQDANGKYYLLFDGIDDVLQTASINFTGTDKVTVWAGVRKLSDLASGMLLELSATTILNRQSFDIRAPSAISTANYFFRSVGSAITASDVIATGYAAPITNLLTMIGEISTDVAIIRVNGAQVASSATDQGTGNYGNYPLYIGSRGGTTLPFNGRLYSLIVRGAQSTAAQITNTENYVNSKTQAY